MDLAAQELFAGGGELGALMRARDWAGSELGPVEKWPQALKTAVRIMLTSRQPMFVWWGNELINLYNDAYRSILGGKHPWALGIPAREVWREIWEEIGPRAQLAMSGNEGTYDEALELIMERNGYPEETYYTFSYSPVPNDEGGTGGIFCANSEDTPRIVGERQLALLRELAARTADARTTDEACRISARCLENAARDLPFALVYLADAEQTTATLKSCAGLPPGHAAAPPVIDLADADAAWPVARVLREKTPLLMTDLAQRLIQLPAAPGWPAPSRAALVPIAPSGQEGRAGVLVAALNPYRLYDDSYEGFLKLVSSQIAAALGNAQAYEEARRRADALAELDRAKTTFFSNVSHEFRTPLMLMLAPTEEALSDEREPLPGVHRERLTLVERNGLRMLKLVNTLLDFARIEAGRVQAAYVPTDLSAFTAELASLFRSAVERAGIELAIECDASLPPAWVDREMWEKIVLNLLSNAFKHTFEGRIGVSLRESEGMARLTVADTGTGIPEDQLDRVFERFHRVEGARGRTLEGTGIGLALVQELTRLHGGRAGAASREGQGSTFTVEIPLGSAHLPPERVRPAPAEMPGGRNAGAYLEEALRWLPETRESGAEETYSVYDTPALVAERGGEAQNSAKPRVLLADDNADMRDYVARLLRENYLVETAPNGRAALEAVRRHAPDILLSDVMMPELDGFGLVGAIRDDPALNTLPVILISARAGEEATVEALAQGADDYLVKPFTARELRARVASNLKLAALRSDAARRERQLRTEAEHSRERMVEVLESIADAFISVDSEWRFTYANHMAASLAQRLAEELNGDPIWEAWPALRGTAVETALRQVAAERRPSQFAFYYAAREMWTEWHAYPAGSGVSAFIADVTQKKRMEDQLRQTAKLESLGVLAGGVAHDFNNLLVGILGNASLAEEMVEDTHPVKPLLRDAVRSGERAAELTHQMLAYSGKGRFVVEPLSLSALVRENMILLKASIPANVQLKLALETEAAVEADRVQMQQLVMNLLLNAAESIGTNPGEVRVSVKETRLNEREAEKLSGMLRVSDGDYVSLIVEDSGCGMSAETREKIFDPFFTTKFTGRGLGLAAVQGIVAAHSGTIAVESEPGVGTTFRVLLPRAPLPAKPDEPAPAAGERDGSGTILVVDDDEIVARTAENALRSRGFYTVNAGNGQEAIDILKRRDGQIHAVLLDMTMPVMTGEQALPLLKSAGRGVPVILASGFSEAEVASRFAGQDFDGFIQKPYTAAALVRAIQRALAKRPNTIGG